MPNHLKIDVDGIESSIIKESNMLLSYENLYDVSIEINEADEDVCEKITNTMNKFGFLLKQKKHASIFDKTEHSSVFNFLFSREIN